MSMLNPELGGDSWTGIAAAAAAVAVVVVVVVVVVDSALVHHCVQGCGSCTVEESPELVIAHNSRGVGSHTPTVDRNRGRPCRYVRHCFH